MTASPIYPEYIDYVKGILKTVANAKPHMTFET